jgi:hypothetical protein
LGLGWWWFVWDLQMPWAFCQKSEGMHSLHFGFTLCFCFVVCSASNDYYFLSFYSFLSFFSCCLFLLLFFPLIILFFSIIRHCR